MRDYDQDGEPIETPEDAAMWREEDEAEARLVKALRALAALQELAACLLVRQVSEPEFKA